MRLVVCLGLLILCIWGWSKWQGGKEQQALAELGRHLFYDKRLSANNNLACSDCHQQAYAFADSRRLSFNTHGKAGRRNSLPLFNLASYDSFTWANPLQTELAFQALIPLFSDDPVEMAASEIDVLAQNLTLSQYDYAPLFNAAFGDTEISLTRITAALAAFQMTLQSYNSPYDQYLAGNKQALSDEAIAGMVLFESERLGCRRCHGGINFNQTLDAQGRVQLNEFHNTGLYYSDMGYPESDLGLYEVSFEQSDNGKFRAPSLRNVTLTAPYMHDGSMAHLAQVIDHYSRGGSLNLKGVQGDGRLNPNKSELVFGFGLTEPEKNQLIAFLAALTDSKFIQNPRFSAPNEQANAKLR
ncbi:di-heme enzyme [Motilimonas sp. 1_MG-2023]|uniref:MbnH family di-heme enzyme n=1 Tax=Motilimonas sp. 1_MG-2023 TaxID=3062672 RepID=UPI0026E34353|nr:MbnH family di-heme enzyme [Motilimonas sp. 1_MG-2023]MDO6527069.1 di-heme enzyme [Motilimonas sp. 1_MG-2023]